MLIGTRVPPNLRNSLDHHGIAWKEISGSTISFLESKCDHDLLRVFEEATVSPLGFPQKRGSVRSSRTKATPKMEHVADNQAGQSGDFGKRENPEQLAELKAALDAYREMAEPDMQFRDHQTKHYCQIFPLGWPSTDLHYEFYQDRSRHWGGIASGFPSGPLKVVSIGEFLKPFAGRPVADGERNWTGSYCIQAMDVSLRLSR